MSIVPSEDATLDEYGFLHHIATVANSARDADAVIQTCVDEICRYTGWPVGHALVLADDASGELVSSKCWHLDDPIRFGDFRMFTEAMRFKPGMGMPGRVLTDGVPDWVPEPDVNSRCARTSAAAQQKIKSGFGIPVPAGERTVAVLEFFSLQPIEPGTKLLRELTEVGRQLGFVIQRKWAEAELERQRELFESVFQCIPDAMLLAGTERKIIFANNALTEVFGYEPQELLGQGSAVLYESGEEFARQSTARFNLSAEEKLKPYLVNYRHKNGEIFPGETIGTKITDRAGNTLGFLAIVRDITDRLRQEEALRESEARFRAVVDNSPHSIYLLDTDRRFILTNKELQRRFGLSADELHGRTADDLVSPPVAEAYRIANEAMLKDPKTIHDVVTQTYPNGTTRTNLSIKFPVLGADGKPTAIGAINTDITELKQQERQLTESDARLRALLDNAPWGIALKDREGRYSLVNREFEQSFDLSDSFAEGKTARELFSPGAADRIESETQTVLETRKAIEIDRVRTRNGQDRHEHLIKFPVTGEAGEIIGVGTIIADVTEQKRIEERLRETDKLNALGKLAGGVAHDFNNILMIISGYATRAIDRSEDPEQVQRALREVVTAADKAGGLTRQLLAFSRRQVLETRIFPAATVLQEMDSMLGPLLGETIQLSIEIRDPSTPIEADSAQLSQALINLAINARDAMPQGGALKIGMAAVEIDAAIIRQNPDIAPGRYLRIHVEDAGTGMDPETATQIFEPFFTTKEQGKGTGLGLAMVYGFVKQSGGALTLDTEPGRGSIFSIYLPVAEKTLTAETALSPDALAGGGETILVAEDDTSLRCLAVMTLEDLGYQVLEAADGMAALEVAAAHDGPIDLLLSDVVMPNLGGIELAKMMREARPGAKTILMSGYPGDGATEQDLSQPGETVFLQKPVDASLLAKSIRELLDFFPAGPGGAH